MLNYLLTTDEHHKEAWLLVLIGSVALLMVINVIGLCFSHLYKKITKKSQSDDSI